MEQSLKEWVKGISTPENLKKDEWKVKDLKDILTEDMNRFYEQYKKWRITKEEYDRYWNFAKNLIEKSKWSIQEVRPQFFEERTNTIKLIRDWRTFLYWNEWDKYESPEKLAKNKLNIAFYVVDLYVEMIRKKLNKSTSKISLKEDDNADIKKLLAFRNWSVSTGNIDSYISEMKSQVIIADSKYKLIWKWTTEVIFRDLLNSKVDNPDHAFAEVLKFFRAKDYELVSDVIESKISKSWIFKNEETLLNKFKTETKKDKKLKDFSSDFFSSLKELNNFGYEWIADFKITRSHNFKKMEKKNILQDKLNNNSQLLVNQMFGLLKTWDQKSDEYIKKLFQRMWVISWKISRLYQLPWRKHLENKQLMQLHELK